MRRHNQAEARLDEVDAAYKKDELVPPDEEPFLAGEIGFTKPILTWLACFPAQTLDFCRRVLEEECFYRLIGVFFVVLGRRRPAEGTCLRRLPGKANGRRHGWMTTRGIILLLGMLLVWYLPSNIRKMLA